MQDLNGGNTLETQAKLWFVRTLPYQLVGPFPTSQLREMLQENRLKGDDEICSGNGFWFSVNERDLVQRFVFGDEAQPHNPITEAQSVDLAAVDYSAVAAVMGIEAKGPEAAPQENPNLSSQISSSASVKANAIFDKSKMQKKVLGPKAHHGTRASPGNPLAHGLKLSIVAAILVALFYFLSRSGALRAATADLPVPVQAEISLKKKAI